MRLTSLALIALLVAVFLPTQVRATCGTMPYTFTNAPSGSVVDANTTNANNQFLLSCASSVDNTQIGPNGIYANQILPTTVAQATFGGAQQYSFLNGLGVTGTVNATNNVTAGTLMIAGSGAGAIVLGGAGNPSTVSPTLSNDQTGGINEIFPTGATYGMRVLSWNGTTFTTQLQVAPSGVVTAGNSFVSPGNVTANGVMLAGTGSTALEIGGSTGSTAFPVLANDSFGGFNAIVPSGTTYGVRFLTYNGSAYATLFQVTPSGALTLNGAATLTGNLQVGPAAAITRGTNATYPYVAGEYAANEHMERGATAAVTTSGASYIFKTTYGTAPTCVGSYGAYASGQTPLSVTSNTTGAIAYGTGAGSGANVICVGN